MRLHLLPELQNHVRMLRLKLLCEAIDELRDTRIFPDVENGKVNIVCRDACQVEALIFGAPQLLEEATKQYLHCPEVTIWLEGEEIWSSTQALSQEPELHLSPNRIELMDDLSRDEDISMTIATLDRSTTTEANGKQQTKAQTNQSAQTRSQAWSVSELAQAGEVTETDVVSWLEAQGYEMAEFHGQPIVLGDPAANAAKHFGMLLMQRRMNGAVSAIKPAATKATTSKAATKTASTKTKTTAKTAAQKATAKKPIARKTATRKQAQAETAED